MEAAPQQASATPEEPEQKLKIDKFADGHHVCLKFSGTIDEDFDGKKLAGTVKAKTLVLDLAEIRKISSFGIREWVDFINNIEKNCERVILLECAPKVVDQLNMVANFAGEKGMVFSFYAPYRCDYCDSDSAVLMQVDSDWDVIKSMKPSERPCGSCGELEYFDEDPTTYFSFIASQEPFELDQELAAFLSSKLNYTVSESARRLKVDKIIEGRSTYLRLAGDLDGSFPREKLAEGMEGMIILDTTGVGVIDPAGAAEWRGFLQMITPAAESIYLLGVPPAFLEKLTKPEDLGPKAQVVTFAMPYSCAKCATTATQLVDVEQHYDVLKFATPPEMKCSDCKNPTVCAATEGLLSHLPTLPKPSISPQTRKFIKEVQERRPPKKATTVAEAGVPKGVGLGQLLGVALLTAALALGGVLMYQYMNRKPDLSGAKIGALLNQGAESRPKWITSEAVPYPRPKTFVGECATAEDDSLSCLGVSSYLDNQEDARVEAEEAAVEAVVNAISVKIEDPDWIANVRGIFDEERQTKLSNLNRLRETPGDPAYQQAHRQVRKARRAVAKSFATTGGKSLLPDSPADEYWEEYEAGSGAATRFLVFVRYEIDGERVKKMVELYSRKETALGATTVTVFPGIAWRYPNIEAGAVIVKLDDGELKDNGLSAEYIIQEVDDRPVNDAASFARVIKKQVDILKDRGGSLNLKVKTGDLGGGDFKIPFKKEHQDRPFWRPRPTGPRPPSGYQIDTWGIQGGGRGGRDDPTQ